MEHHHQLLHCLSPQEHLAISSGFFVDADGDPLRFHDGGFVEPVAAAGACTDDVGWMEDLMQLGDELFGGGDNNVVVDMGELASEPSRDDGDMSATRKRKDRSKTIVSERKRRVRMKEKLYELRSLVPNITKMDKVSIIADAVVYVKNLQSHAKKLKEEVAMLEARPASPGRQKLPDRRQGQHGHGKDERSSGLLHGARVTHVGTVQVGEGRFFVTVECERRDGVAAPLWAAIESLACLRVESSNLRCSPDRVVSTLTLKASEVGEDAVISECTVKLWLTAALLKGASDLKRRSRSPDPCIDRPMFIAGLSHLSVLLSCVVSC